MQVHASCAARDGAGVLLIGPSGSGKSDLMLRLMDHGFEMVADDRVEIEAGVARAPAALAGLMEVRGLGILRLPFRPDARLSLVVRMGVGDRLPEPERHLGLPLVHVDPTQPSAPARVAAALRCALGQADLVVGAFA
jgi:HPr kinase/phosphorylase